MTWIGVSSARVCGSRATSSRSVRSTNTAVARSAPGPSVQTDAEIDAFVRQHAETALHPSCTCKMGSADDSMAVVDNEGRVHGLQGLRVVDASIMPRIVTGNLNAPTIMIAEKIADRIRGDGAARAIGCGVLCAWQIVRCRRRPNRWSPVNWWWPDALAESRDDAGWCGGVCCPLPALADDVPAGEDKRWSANASVVSQYVSRGLRQTWGKPALQAGIDYTAPSGFYAGVLGSQVSDHVIAGAHAEIDTYLGYADDRCAWRGIDHRALPLLVSRCPLRQGRWRRPATGYDYTEWMVGAGWRGVSVKLWTTLSNYFGFDGNSLADGIDRGSRRFHLRRSQLGRAPVAEQLHARTARPATNTCVTTAAFSSYRLHRIRTLAAHQQVLDAVCCFDRRGRTRLCPSILSPQRHGSHDARPTHGRTQADGDVLSGGRRRFPCNPFSSTSAFKAHTPWPPWVLPTLSVWSASPLMFPRTLAYRSCISRRPAHSPFASTCLDRFAS
ncbi:TorF family putative porin [Cupriavidus basilensis]